MKLIYAPGRQVTDIQMDQYVAIAEELPDFFAGFDLVSTKDEGQPLVKFANKLRELGNDDFQFFFHASETNCYGTSVDRNLIDAVLLNTKRIGHGYAVLKHPKVMELVCQRNIFIEMSPISNQVFNFVNDIRNHSASVLLAQNYPIVVSNDDPGLWYPKALSYDLYKAFAGIMSRDVDLRAFKKLAINSIEYMRKSELRIFGLSDGINLFNQL